MPRLCKTVRATFCTAQCSLRMHAFAFTLLKRYSSCALKPQNQALTAVPGLANTSLRRKPPFYVASAYRITAGSVADFQITLEQLAVRLFLGNIPLLMNTAPECKA